MRTWHGVFGVRIGTGLAVALMGVALVGGCGSKSDDSGEVVAAPSVSPAPVDAKPKLAAAAAKSSGTSFKFRSEDPAAAGIIEGAVDPAAAASTAKMSVDLDGANKLTFESIKTGGTFYVKITGLPAAGGTDLSKYWMKADPAKITGDLGVLSAKDPIDVRKVVANAASVQNVDGTLYTGTLDLTQESLGVLYDADLAKELGDKAKAVPFAASVNADGYLTSVKVSVPAYGTEPASDTTVTLTDFGRPVTATAPTGAQVITMPDAMYTALNAQ
jgi:hypothetical protein